MELRIVLMAILLAALAVHFPPAHSVESDILMAALFAIAVVCSLGRIYSHSRITVATAMPRSSASDR